MFTLHTHNVSCLVIKHSSWYDSIHMP